MTLRWGRRSTGGVVRRGHGGWYLALGWPPSLTYTDPETGDSATRVGWNVRASYRFVVETHARHRTRRAAAA